MGATREPEGSCVGDEKNKTWKIIAVDDDKDVHQVTRLALKNFLFNGKGIEILSAYSGKEARELFREHPDTAVILLDIVMESDNSGLELIRYIRQDLGNKFVRIVVRTGQPGQAPEDDVVVNYDINHYNLKSELTAQKLTTTIITSLRAYEDMITLDRLRNHQEEIVQERTAALKEANKELYKANAEVREAYNYKDNLINSSLDMIIAIDEDMNTVEINKAAQETLGYALMELAGNPVDILYAHSTEGRLIEKALASSGRFTGEITYKCKKGNTFPAFLSASGLYDTLGQLTGYIGISRDITERKKWEAMLLKAKESAEKANRTKSEFLANVSHELRTPMNGIIGMTDLLLYSPLSAEQKDILGTLRRSAESLLDVLNNILSFSSIETGKMELASVRFDMHHMLEDIVDSFAGLAHKKGIDLLYSIRPDVPFEFIGDPGRLRQVIVNLLGNAVKFTEKGEVLLEVKVEEWGLVPPETPLLEGQPGLRENLEHCRLGREHPDQGNTREYTLSFSIKDTGIGIPEDKITVIFDSFTQVDSSATRKYGGTGLGLSISKELVRLMGGCLTVDSTEGEGSTFSFNAKLIAHEDGLCLPVPPMNLAQEKILVVVGGVTLRIILSELLSEWGAQVTATNDCEFGLADLESALISPNPYTIVMLDSRISCMGGFDLAEYIRKEIGYKGNIVMLLSSNHRRGDISRCRTLGISGYLFKPVKRTALLNLLTNIVTPIVMSPSLENERLETQTRLASLHNPGKKCAISMNILVVEDNPTSQFLTSTILTKSGHNAVVVNDGKTALKILERENFDVVLMDIQMPDMTGFDVTREIRSSASKVLNRDIPIIAVTAFPVKGDIDGCLDAGINDYVTKPLRPKEFIERIERFMPKGRATGEALNKPKDKLKHGTVNWKDLLERLDAKGNTQGLVYQSMEILVARIDSILSAIENNEIETIEEDAQAIKDAARSIGGEQMKNEAFRLVLASRKDDTSNIGKIVKNLEYHLLELFRTYGV